MQTEASLPTLLSRLSGLFGPPGGSSFLGQLPSFPRVPQAPDQAALPPGGGSAAAASGSGPPPGGPPSASADPAAGAGVWRTFSDMMQVRARPCDVSHTDGFAQRRFHQWMHSCANVLRRSQKRSRSWRSRQFCRIRFHPGCHEVTPPQADCMLSGLSARGRAACDSVFQGNRSLICCPSHWVV